MTRGIDPETYLQRVLFTKHQTIETQVSQGALIEGADYNRNCNRNRNRNAMIEQGLIMVEQSKIFWQSAPLPNDGVDLFSLPKVTVGKLALAWGWLRKPMIPLAFLFTFQSPFEGVKA